MKLSLKKEGFSQLEKLNQIKEKIMNNRWRQIFKDFKKWNTEIQKAASFSYAKASDNAKLHKSLYGRILTSTPQ